MILVRLGCWLVLCCLIVLQALLLLLVQLKLGVLAVNDYWLALFISLCNFSSILVGFDSKKKMATGSRALLFPSLVDQSIWVLMAHTDIHGNRVATILADISLLSCHVATPCAWSGLVSRWARILQLVESQRGHLAKMAEVVICIASGSILLVVNWMFADNHFTVVLPTALLIKRHLLDILIVLTQLLACLVLQQSNSILHVHRPVVDFQITILDSENLQFGLRLSLLLP